MERFKILILLLFLTLVSLSMLGIVLGSEILSIDQVFQGLSGEGKFKIIIIDYRLPKVLTSILVGAALSISGLMMQSYFRNALAGPYILGISSGASLGVALLLLASNIFSWSLSNSSGTATLFSILGSAISLFVIMLLSRKIGNGPMLLITGLMLASFASAIISVLQFFAPSEAIKKFLIWTMGSLSSVDNEELLYIGPLLIIFITLTFLLANPLNALLLGYNHAKSLGIDHSKTKWQVILITGVLAGTVTAYCGPIAFIGLSAPHLSRLMLKSQDHHKLIPFTALLGSILLLLCNIISQLPGLNIQLPINAVTSLIGAPIVISIILKSAKFVKA